MDQMDDMLSSLFSYLLHWPRVGFGVFFLFLISCTCMFFFSCFVLGVAKAKTTYREAKACSLPVLLLCSRMYKLLLVCFSSKRGYTLG